MKHFFQLLFILLFFSCTKQKNICERLSEFDSGEFLVNEPMQCTKLQVKQNSTLKIDVSREVPRRVEELNIAGTLVIEASNSLRPGIYTVLEYKTKINEVYAIENHTEYQIEPQWLEQSLRIWIKGKQKHVKFNSNLDQNTTMPSFIVSQDKKLGIGFKLSNLLNWEISQNTKDQNKKINFKTSIISTEKYLLDLLFYDQHHQFEIAGDYVFFEIEKLQNKSWLNFYSTNMNQIVQFNHHKLVFDQLKKNEKSVSDLFIGISHRCDFNWNNLLDIYDLSFVYASSVAEIKNCEDSIIKNLRNFTASKNPNKLFKVNTLKEKLPSLCLEECEQKIPIGTKILSYVGQLQFQKIKNLKYKFHRQDHQQYIIFDNPIKTEFFLDFVELKQIELLDHFGQIIYRHN